MLLKRAPLNRECQEFLTFTDCQNMIALYDPIVVNSRDYKWQSSVLSEKKVPAALHKNLGVSKNDENQNTHTYPFRRRFDHDLSQ